MSTSKQLPWMKWFPRDYISSSRHLSLAERGALTDLLFLQWDTGPLPADHERLARMIGCTLEEFEAIWPAIAEKFMAPDGLGRLANERLEATRREAMEVADANTRKARVAAVTRWDKHRRAVGHAGNGSGHD